MSKNVVLSLLVTYESSQEAKTLAYELEEAIRSAIGNGLLTGDSPNEVSRYDISHLAWEGEPEHYINPPDEALVPRVIKTDEQHEAYLAEVENLMDLGDEGRTKDQSERLELLALLVESYEKEKYPIWTAEEIEQVHKDAEKFREFFTHNEDPKEYSYPENRTCMFCGTENPVSSVVVHEDTDKPGSVGKVIGQVCAAHSLYDIQITSKRKGGHHFYVEITKMDE